MVDGGFVGVLSVDVRFPWARSLKDKRGPLRSIKDRLGNAGLSVAEVAGHNQHGFSRLTLAAAATSESAAASRLGEAREIIDSRQECEMFVNAEHIRSLGDLE